MKNSFGTYQDSIPQCRVGFPRDAHAFGSPASPSTSRVVVDTLADAMGSNEQTPPCPTDSREVLQSALRCIAAEKKDY